MGGKHTSEISRASVIIWPKFLELLLMSDSREDVVKALRALARAHGVEQVRDGAGKERLLVRQRALTGRMMTRKIPLTMDESFPIFSSPFG